MPQSAIPKPVFRQPPSNVNPSAVPRVALAAIVLGTVSFAAFCVVGRIAEVADPAMGIHGSQKIIMPWHDEARDPKTGAVTQAQYKYRNAFGHIEEAPPAMTEPFRDEHLITRSIRRSQL